MSTDYYRIAPPITKLHAEPIAEHVRLTFWINDAVSGFLTLRNEELPQMLLLLRGEVPRVNAHFGGYPKRFQLSPDPIAAPDNLQLISEYGDLAILGQLRSRIGTGAR